jgi:hypothetical protein
LDPGERPVGPGLPRAEANNYGFAVSIQNRTRNRLKISHCFVHFWEVFFICAEDGNIIDIAEAGLVCLTYTKAGQLRLEAAQQRLDVEEEKEHCQGVSLADGEEDE